MQITCLNLFLHLEGNGKAAFEAKGWQFFYHVQSSLHSAPHQKYMPPVSSLNLNYTFNIINLYCLVTKGLGKVLDHLHILHSYITHIKIINMVTDSNRMSQGNPTPGGLSSVFLHSVLNEAKAKFGVVKLRGFSGSFTRTQTTISKAWCLQEKLP